MFFSASMERIIWLFSFIMLMWRITWIDLQILNRSCIPRIKPTSSWCIIIFLYCRILFVNILNEILHLRYIHEKYWSILFFWYIRFWYEDNTALRVLCEFGSVLGIPKTTFRFDSSLGLTGKGRRKLLYIKLLITVYYSEWIQIKINKGKVCGLKPRRN